MQKSETIGELAKALALAQGEIQNAKKDSENPFFRSKYADLAAVREACQEPLSKHGLAVIQLPKTTITEEGPFISVETILCHSSGEWVSEELGALPVKTDPQSIGSCITYLRRYSLSAVAGVASEDDDGNAASTPAATPAKKNLKAVEREQLMQKSVDICRLLKQAGDKPWGTKRLDEFCMTEFGVRADKLETELLPELLTKLKARLDNFQKGIVPNGGDEAERLAKIAEITAEIPADVVQAELTGVYQGRALSDLSLVELKRLHEAVSIPF